MNKELQDALKYINGEMCRCTFVRYYYKTHEYFEIDKPKCTECEFKTTCESLFYSTGKYNQPDATDKAVIEARARLKHLSRDIVSIAKL